MQARLTTKLVGDGAHSSEGQDADGWDSLLLHPQSHGHSYQRQGQCVWQWPASIKEKMKLRAEQQSKSIAHSLS